ncbi:MAG: XRE family transcriptional regulator [Gammaproteobacteria bacterium]
MTTKTTFQTRLAGIIQRFGSASGFARKAGVSDQMVRKYLSENTQPGMENLVAMCRAAEVPMWWLATGEDADPHVVPGSIPPKPAELDPELLREAIEEAFRLSALDSTSFKQATQAGLVGLIASIYRVKAAAKHQEVAETVQPSHRKAESA